MKPGTLTIRPPLTRTRRAFVNVNPSTTDHGSDIRRMNP
jgi:hypothetical protein